MPRSVRSRTRAPSVSALLILAMAFVSASGSAQSTGSDAVLARSLFDSGKTLMSAGKTDEACEKFAESQKLDPRSGTLLNLAVCREKQGRTATAWLLFKEALPLAKKDGRRDREQLARTRIAALEPRLSRIRVEVPWPVDGLEVSLDGISVGRAVWNEPAPVDPGDHRIEARAPGRKPWGTTVMVGPNADRQDVHVPQLEPAAPVVGASSAPPPPQPPAPPVPDRTLAYVIGGTGVALAGVGLFFGWRASQRWDEAQTHCVDAVCDADATSLSKEANTAAWASNVGIGLGLAGVGVATWMLLSPRGEQPAKASAGRVRAAPLVGTSWGLGVSGGF